MGYWILLIFLCTIFYVALRALNYEIFSPAPLCMLGFLTSTIFAIVGQSSWNTQPLGLEAFLIVAVGCVMFTAGCIVSTKARFAHGFTTSTCASREHEDEGLFRSSWWKYALLAGFVAAAISLQVWETYQIALDNSLDTSNFMKMAKQVRDLTSTMYSAGGVSFNSGFSFACRQLQKLTIAIGYVLACRLGWLISKPDTLRQRLRDLIVVLLVLFLCCLDVLLTGGRRDILYFSVAGISSYALFCIRDGISSRKVLKKAMIICVILLPIAMVLFWLASSWVGRWTNSGLFEYISFYFGCGIPTLQKMIEEGIKEATQFGQYTLYYFYSFLYKFGLVQNLGSSSLGWVRFGEYVSNVPTSFAGYYFDFGLVGVAFLTFLAGVVLTFVYRVARESNIPAFVSLVGFFSGYILDMARANASSIGYILSPSRMITACLVLLIAFLLFNNIRLDRLLMTRAIKSPRSDD